MLFVGYFSLFYSLSLPHQNRNCKLNFQKLLGVNCALDRRKKKIVNDIKGEITGKSLETKERTLG